MIAKQRYGEAEAAALAKFGSILGPVFEGRILSAVGGAGARVRTPMKSCQSIETMA